MGRHKTFERTINSLLWDSRGQIPNVWKGIVASAVKGRKVTCPHCRTKFDVPGGGNLDAQKYIIDRAYGKPSQILSLEAKKPSVTGDDLVGIADAVREKEKLLLGTIEGEYEVIEDVDSGKTAVDEGICSGDEDTQPTDDGIGESSGSDEPEVSSEEEE